MHPVRWRRQDGGEFYAEAAIPLDPSWATQAFASLLEDPRRGVAARM